LHLGTQGSLSILVNRQRLTAVVELVDRSHYSASTIRPMEFTKFGGPSADGRGGVRNRERSGGIELLSSACRFCQRQLDEPSSGMCHGTDCLEASEDACQQQLDCGHWCGGIRDEFPKCPPCFQCCTTSSNADSADDRLCVICFTRLVEAPCVQLQNCGHLFHYRCVKEALEQQWQGPQISFQ
jgi:hypothetical protein